ncbi:MAG: hypothetical protein ACRDID_04390 [Ktedonobacterales bacterium]
MADQPRKPSLPSSSSHATPIPPQRHTLQAPSWILALGNAYLKVLGAIILGLIIDAIAIVVGLGGLGTNYLAPIMARYPLPSLAVGFVLIVVAILSFFASSVLASDAGNSGTNSSAVSIFSTWQQRAILVSLSFGTLSVLITSGLVGILVARPSWCYSHLTWACPGPAVLAGSGHDTNLEVRLVTVQQSAVVLAADPSTYTLATLPTGLAVIPAVQIVPRSQQTGISTLQPNSYRVVLDVHSLERGAYGLRITGITLEVIDIPSQPRPLNVWIQGSSIIYQSEPYRIVYNGQSAGSSLSAHFVGSSTAYTHLKPTESDTLTLQIDSSVPANLRYRLAISYQLDNTSMRGHVTLPGVFEVAFGAPTNWHPYNLKGGRLVPG